MPVFLKSSRRERWEASRLSLTADGEKDKAWGNETIRWNPDQNWLEIRLPTPLAHLANRPSSRYRLSCPVAFTYRAGDVAAQAATGAVRYDISFDPARGRWYLDASWKTPPAAPVPLAAARQGGVVAVDVNAGHLAVAVLDPDGNPAGVPYTIGLPLAGLPSATRDGRLRAPRPESPDGPRQATRRPQDRSGGAHQTGPTPARRLGTVSDT